MKRLAILTWCVAAALISARASAAVTAAEADKLGKELTPFGAEKAANADGTIPAYEGNEPALPGWEFGKVRKEYWKYKDEKPLFSIDASNVDKYKDHLDDGQITALKTVKGYRMDVYPTHRNCGITPVYAERTKANATEAKIAADGWSLEHAKTSGVPFPIPKSGIEVMYNIKLRPGAQGSLYHDGTSVISPRPGSDEFTWYQWYLTTYWPTKRADRRMSRTKAMSTSSCITRIPSRPRWPARGSSAPSGRTRIRSSTTTSRGSAGCGVCRLMCSTRR